MPSLPKLRGALFAPFFILSAVVLSALAPAFTTASEEPTLVNAPQLFINKVAGISPLDIPPGVFGGNVECQVVYESKCSVDTPYGAVSDSSLWNAGKFRPIEDFGGSSAHFYPIPNSDTALTTSNTPVFGSYLYFTHDASLALAPKYVARYPGADIKIVDNLLLDHYQLNRIYDYKLSDKSGQRLAADTNSIGFSGNSEWMVVTDPNIATLRVNISNGNVLPFGPRLTYGLGLNPSPKNAISSDGRYAAVANGESLFSIYDLSTCATVPTSIFGPVDCQSKNLISSGFLSQQIPGYFNTYRVRFLDDNTLKFYASYKEGTQIKYALYTLSTKPGPVTKSQYLALGDSYISGEGAFHYQQGTDTDENHCHVSLDSYPYLLGQDLNFNSYHSVACSGAVTADIAGKKSAQATGKDDASYDDEIYNNFLPGYRSQINFVTKNQPQAITVSIGGNDIGFGNIVLNCIGPDTCYNTHEDRLELVREVNAVLYPNLVNTYQKIKSESRPDSRIYAIGYPQIVKPDGNCGLNVRLNAEETEFAQQLISYLNQVIKAAADKAQVRYVNTEDALNGYQLCEGQSGSIAVNGLTSGNDKFIPGLGPFGNESYHPNAFGHRLLEQAILRTTNNLTQSMPTSSSNTGLPPEASLALLNVPHSDRQINTLRYNDNLANNIEFKNQPWTVTLDQPDLKLMPSTTAKLVLHSDPIELGQFSIDQSGRLSATITPSSDLPIGYHELHILGTAIDGSPIDIYKTIFVAETPESLQPSTDDNNVSNDNPGTPTDDTTTASESVDNSKSAQNAPSATNQNTPQQISFTAQPDETIISQPANSNTNEKVLAETTNKNTNSKNNQTNKPKTSHRLIIIGAIAAVGLIALVGFVVLKLPV